MGDEEREEAVVPRTIALVTSTAADIFLVILAATASFAETAPPLSDTNVPASTDPAKVAA